METRHPVENYFVGEFTAICDHFWVMAAWTRKSWKKVSTFGVFWKKTTPYGDIFQILFWKNSSRHRSTCCVQISWNLADGKSVKLCVAYLTKNLRGSPALATVQIAPKICRGQPLRMCSECSRFHPNRFTFGGVIPERVNTIKTGRTVFPVFGWSLASSRIMTCIIRLYNVTYVRKICSLYFK